MSDASRQAPTIRPEEAAHFGRLAADWWDPKGSSAMLHQLNPVRLGFIRAAIDAHWGTVGAARPLADKRALDVGCGAGLLAEPLSRMGAQVTGVDAAAENIAAARSHADAMDLPITYHAGEVSALDAGRYDLVTSLEVLEHVADKGAFLAGLRAHLAPGGLMILSTPNRTFASRILMVEGAERIGAIPRGTHDWESFVTPDELTTLVENAGLRVMQSSGIKWTPGKGLHLSPDVSLNYIIALTSQEMGLKHAEHK